MNGLQRLDQQYRDQPSLFDAPPPVRELARLSHPQTSHEAAEKLIASGRLAGDSAAALDMVREHPGLTGYELQNLDRSGRDDRIRKRLGGLANSGLLRRGESRRCRVKGSMCVTWYPAIGVNGE